MSGKMRLIALTTLPRVTAFSTLPMYLANPLKRSGYLLINRKSLADFKNCFAARAAHMRVSTER
jgi:hypothetical protein